MTLRLAHHFATCRRQALRSAMWLEPWNSATDFFSCEAGCWWRCCRALESLEGPAATASGGRRAVSRSIRCNLQFGREPVDIQQQVIEEREELLGLLHAHLVERMSTVVAG